MIKTLVNVTCSENGKVAPYSGKVVGRILAYSSDMNVLSINYQYEKEDGTYLMSGVKTYDMATVNGLYTQIESELNPFVDWSSSRKDELYTAFLKEMALTFSIDESDIEKLY